MDEKIKKRIELIKLYYTLKLSYSKFVEYVNVYRPNLKITKSALRKLVDKFETTGSVLDKSRCGRPNIRSDLLESVKQSLDQDKTLSIRTRSKALGISKSTLLRILKELKLKSNIKRNIQQIEQSDNLIYNGKEIPQLECENESDYFCKKYQLNTVICKHFSDSFTCSSEDMAIFITFYTATVLCKTKNKNDKWYYYPVSCYLRYTLGFDWLSIAAPIVGFLTLLTLVTYGCV